MGEENTLDIAGLSIVMNQQALKTEVDTRVTKMALDQAKLQSDALLKMLEETTKVLELSVEPHLGSLIDISV